MEFWETLKGYITPETITVCITVFSFLVALLKMVSTIKELKAQKIMTLENVLKNLSIQNAEEFDKEKNILVSTIIELITPLIEYSEAMAKVLALSQENTPESRVAILEIVQSLGTIDKDLVEKAKNIVVNETIEKEEKKKVVVEQLTAIENKPIE